MNLVSEDGINITFFRDDYQLLYPEIKTDSINLMDIRNIAANKAFIQGKRPKWRDYVDIYSIIKTKHMTLDQIIKTAQNKFESDFTPKLFLEQLIYWDDIYSYEIEFIGHDIDPGKIKKFLKDEVRNFNKKTLNL